MDIGMIYYVHVVKSISWTMIGCWPRNRYISIYRYWLVSVMSLGLY